MVATAPPGAPRQWWRRAVRAGLSIVLVVAVGCWMLTAWFLLVFRCDDNCGVGDADKWQWTGQAVLAVTGGSLAVLALAYGFTHHRVAYRTLLTLSAGCAVVWVWWVLVSGQF